MKPLSSPIEIGRSFAKSAEYNITTYTSSLFLIIKLPSPLPQIYIGLS